MMIQVDATKRHVYIKFTEECYAAQILQYTTDPLDYKHPTGEISKVRIERAGMGTRRVRIANLPPEVPERVIRRTLEPYGDVQDVQDEQWSRAYRYPVANGIKVAIIKLRKHIPSHVNIAGHRTLVSYEGQPATCYRCGEEGHNHQQCPYKHQDKKSEKRNPEPSWAQILVNGPHAKQHTTEGQVADQVRETDQEQQQDRRQEPPSPPLHPTEEKREATRGKEAGQQEKRTEVNQEQTQPPTQQNTGKQMEGPETEGREQRSKGAPKRSQHNKTPELDRESEGEEEMITDDHPDDGDTHTDTQPPASTDQAIGTEDTEEGKTRNKTRPKKIRLDANSDRHTDRKRSRVRNVSQ